MFGIMYEMEDGKIFKVCKTLDEAQIKANNIACMGISVTIFDFDMEKQEYLEFYTI